MNFVKLADVGVRQFFGGKAKFFCFLVSFLSRFVGAKKRESPQFVTQLQGFGIFYIIIKRLTCRSQCVVQSALFPANQCQIVPSIVCQFRGWAAGSRFEMRRGTRVVAIHQHRSQVKVRGIKSRLFEQQRFKALLRDHWLIMAGVIDDFPWIRSAQRNNRQREKKCQRPPKE